MGNLGSLLLTTLHCVYLCVANSAPTITDVSAFQRTDGSGIVDISYTLLDRDNDKCTISMLVSSDGGNTWATSATNFLAGSAIGPNISSGRKAIFWNSKVDLPGVFSNNYKVKILADDLNSMISYYKLDCTTGPVIDEFGRNPATNSGALRGVAGLFGKCFDFRSSSTNYVEVSSFSGLVNTPFSVSLWVNIVSAETYDSIIQFLVYPNPDINIRVQFSNSSTLMLEYYDGITRIYENPTTSFNGYFNKWTEIKFSVSSTKMEFFLDGVKKIDKTINQHYFPRNPVMILGNADYRTRNRAVNGKIDEVKIWLGN